MTRQETLLEIAQDGREDGDSFSPWAGGFSVLAVVLVILLIWGDGGWPWQRKHP